MKKHSPYCLLTPHCLSLIVALVALLLPLASYSQTDTLKVMQYNLLNYGNNTSYCTSTNNNVNDKNGYIRTILTAYYPDILTVCEMGSNSTNSYNFLNNNLNINGIDYWKMSIGSNSAHSDIINCIFYNSTKLELISHYTAQVTLRDVDVYNFSFKQDNSNKIILTCVIAHLKAGDGTSNVNQRKTMALNIMRYLEMNYRECNVLIMGDFNLYTSEEPAYQLFTNSNTYPYSYFIDPLYDYGVGAWNNNSRYRYYHTQSTHQYSDSNCHSSGGMDDRFDFILMSENIYGGRDGIRYIGNSYNALGQDGQRFDRSINNPTNSVVSRDVANALFHNSDHLPVTMELAINLNIGVDENAENILNFDVFPNPASDNIYIRFYQDKIGKANILLFNTLGQMVYSEDTFVNDCLSEHVISVDNLPKGLYFLKITNADGKTNTSKIIVE